jgi:phage host-nuclease inhibitor protein Gam
MDKETKEYLDRKFLGLVSKDDIEKLRQETKANFRQLKEEINPIREEIREGLQKVRGETQSALDQSRQVIESSLQRVREEGEVHVIHSRDETRADIDRVGEGMEGIKVQVKQMAEEVTALNGKIVEGFKEAKEELGSMIKFSYADLEKKINALEVRIKALEKMVFP